MADSGVIETTSQFKDTPQGLQQRWQIEIDAAKKNQEKWWKEAEEISKRYLGKGPIDAYGPRSKLNLFHSNVDTMLAILYGQMPQVDVSRRFADAEDDVARVGGEIIERILNTDIECDDDGFRPTLRYSLQDWKITGLGVARVRYECEMETQPEQPAIMDEAGNMMAPAVPAQEVKKRSEPKPQIPGQPPQQPGCEEEVETDYIHWRDFLWSPCRTWSEVRWVAFKAEMTRDELVKRFGKELGKQVPLQKRMAKEGDLSEPLKDAWSRAEVWEIWSKEGEYVCWFNDGMDKILDRKDDPLGLDGFFPCPRPLIANATTVKLMPEPDFNLAKDLYNEIDGITYRLKKLEQSAKVVGCYDASVEELQRIWEEAAENQLVGVRNWTAFAEKGGLQGAMAFVPLDPIIKGIEVLTAKRAEKIQLLYQITGLSDIVRGQATERATATEQRIKAGFASTRLQTDQDEVARFASDLSRLKAEIISKHFDPATILDRSNIRFTADAQNAQAAVQLVKSDFWQYRVEIKADSIALRDYAQLKQERSETVATMAGLFQQAAPMVQMAGPKVIPFLLEVSKWLIAATKGSSQMEAVFDKYAQMAEQMAMQPLQPKPPDPRLQAAQVKAQAEMGKARATMQQTGMDMQQSQMEHQMDMQKMAAQAALDRQKMQNGLAVTVPPVVPTWTRP